MSARGLLLSLAVLLCYWPFTAASQETSDSATIRNLETKWAEAYKKRQVDVLSSLIADDYVITFEDGSVYGKVGFLSHTAEPSEQVASSEFSDLKIRMYGNTAVVTGRYHENGESKGKRYEYFDRLTDVWMKIDGQWKLIASHYSVPMQ